jgi:hypothetical protein
MKKTLNLKFSLKDSRKPPFPYWQSQASFSLVPRYFKSLLQFLLCDHEVEDKVSCDEVTSSPKVHDFAR